MKNITSLLLSLALSAQTLFADDAPAGQKLFGAGKVLRDIVYKTVGNTKVLMDIYYPLEKRYKRAPVFYYTHGGGWFVGSKQLDDAQVTLFSRLLKKGVVCVSINYRLVSASTPEHPVQMRDCVIDSKDGLRFLKKNQEKYGLDMSRVVTYGTSAGAHISLLATYSKPGDFLGDPAQERHHVIPRGCVSWSGPTDFTNSDLFVPAGMKPTLPPNRFTSRIKTGAPRISYQEADTELKRMMKEVSPIEYLTPQSPPVLQIHGDLDGTIPLKHALRLKKRASKLGASVRVITVKGAGHSFNDKPAHKPNRESLIQSSVDFTIQQLSAMELGDPKAE